MSARLEAAGIEKAFAGVRVLSGVSLQVGAGELLGLVGENGAGKSTLLNVLGGVLPADAGSLRLDGEPFAPRDPHEAHARGVAFIHQELSLFPNLSVAENLALADLPRRFGFVDRTRLLARARRALGRVGLELDPARALGELAPGARQLVEIARELSGDARVVILDEPTTSLTRPEIQRLFELLASLRAEGRALVLVSHALADVRRICDRIVVMRDGAVVGGGTPAELQPERLVSLMVGRSLGAVFPERAVARPRGAVALEIRDLTRPGAFERVSLRVAAGEVLGVAGLLGAGRTELLRAIFGLDPAAAGELRVFGRAMAPSPRAAMAAGLCLVTEERRVDGLMLDAPVARNLELSALERFARPLSGALRLGALQAETARAAASVELDRQASLTQPARTLSGGNQQKLVLGKWLLTEPRVVLLDEPTRGVDIGARQQIYRLVASLADAGAGVLLVSSELEELIGLSDRIVALCRGRLAGEWSRAEFDDECILAACFGAEAGGDLST